jgi:hypothetical protein
MEVFEIYADNKFCGFTESLQDAMVAATLLVSDFEVRIEHPCDPSPTAIWRHDSKTSDWVRMH